MTLSGINIILMIGRSLKLMDFQPRLGIVTKTLARAASDILHFMVVFGVVFMGYVMMGTLVFGYKIKEFSSLSRSLRTCFETLLGEIGWNEQLYDLDDQLVVEDRRWDGDGAGGEGRATRGRLVEVAGEGAARTAGMTRV